MMIGEADRGGDIADAKVNEESPSHHGVAQPLLSDNQTVAEPVERGHCHWCQMSGRPQPWPTRQGSERTLEFEEPVFHSQLSNCRRSQWGLAAEAQGMTSGPEVPGWPAHEEPKLLEP